MKLDQIFSHPKTNNPRTGKLLTIHTDGVTEKALKKYKGPEMYKKYLKLIGIFHDIGKLNPNFQNYIFDERVLGYKNHSYLSAIVLLILLIKNQQKFQSDYDLDLLIIALILISKHHGNLPDFLDLRLNPEELDKVVNFFEVERDIASDFIENANEFLNHYEFDFTELTLSDFDSKYILKSNQCISGILGNISLEKKLEYFLIIQYIFSCLIEGDKRDAGDNNTFQLEKELEVFSAEYFNSSLDAHYEKFKKLEETLSDEKKELNKLRSEIKDKCVKNVKKYIKQGERVFQIISPTGSGKTLTFLSVAGAIKETLPNKKLKFIYSIPFLSITDQVSKECEEIFNDNKQFIYRVDSAAKVKDENELSEINDSDMKEDRMKAIADFSENIFDGAFIVTTFVKLFETLTSNRNKTLLRYNNFSESIIIIDEIQSLPPRSYTFLVALLSKFAELFDSYIIIGSATVPIFEIPENNADSQEIKKLFHTYKPPINLLDDYIEKYKNNNFLRYSIEYKKDLNTIDQFCSEVINSNTSTLCVLNTRKSSLELYNKLQESLKSSVFLLNTNQTLRDRRRKLDEVKKLLNEKKKVILVSTQLIEAGVDISFPLVYRDLAPFPSIIQTAGRCNRSKEIEIGKTIICCLMDENNKNKEFYKYVYTDLMDFTLNDVVNKLEGQVNENELLEYQKIFFTRIKENLRFGKFGTSEKLLHECVQNFMFTEISRFNLIEKEEFDSVSIYIIQNQKDKDDWNSFKHLQLELQREPFNFNNKAKIKEARRLLSDNILSLNKQNLKNNIHLLSMLEGNTVFGLSALNLLDEDYFGINYTYEQGLVINKDESPVI